MVYQKIFSDDERRRLQQEREKIERQHGPGFGGDPPRFFGIPLPVRPCATDNQQRGEKPSRPDQG